MNVLLVGASGGIANTIGEELLSRGHVITAVSRSEPKLKVSNYLQADMSKANASKNLNEWLCSLPKEQLPSCVINCSGILHASDKMPEKGLKQISPDWLFKTMQVNLYSHIQTAQAIDALINRRKPVRWISLSALVGSISENQLGGWYSYRMSKAALNMFIRNLDIEWRRKSLDSIVVALHPGTTKTNLSEPFQTNIAEGKLYEPELTGRRLVDVIERLRPEQSGQLLHWDGSIVPY